MSDITFKGKRKEIKGTGIRISDRYYARDQLDSRHPTQPKADLLFYGDKIPSAIPSAKRTFNMAYYNDPHRRTTLPQIQAGSPLAGGNQYLPTSDPFASQGIGFPGGPRTSFSGVPRVATHPALMAGQQYMQPQYIPQTVPQTAPGYGTTPAAQYMAATQAAAAQQAGIMGQNPYEPTHPGMVGGGMSVPGVPNATMQAHAAHSYPGASGQYYGGQGQQGDILPPRHNHHHSRKKGKSRIRKIVEELLAGGGGLAAALHEEKRHRRGRANSESLPSAPNVEHPPRGSAPGFLHPKGHFVPGAIDDLANHFKHKKGDMAPEGSQPGYLHSGGHFVPLAIDALVAEFAHTLLTEHQRRRGRSQTPTRHGHHGTRSDSSTSSSESDYSESESDTTSEREGEYGRSRR